jgi:hypothetical protein
MAGSSNLSVFQKAFILFLVNFCGKRVVELLEIFAGCQQTINRAAKDNLPSMTKWYQGLSQWQQAYAREAALGRLAKEEGADHPGTFQDWADMRIRQAQRDNGDVGRVVDVSDLLTNTPGLAAPLLTPNGGGGHASGAAVQTPGGAGWGWAEGGTPDAQTFLDVLHVPAGADLSPESADGVCVSVHRAAK